MENYFKPRFEKLDKKITSWNNKNFFQRLFASEKWSNEDTCDEVEKIFQIEGMNQIQSPEDFKVYMKYFMKYHNALSDSLSNTIVERLLVSDHISPEVEILLKQFQEANVARQHHNNQAMDIVNNLYNRK